MQTSSNNEHVWHPTLWACVLATAIGLLLSATVIFAFYPFFQLESLPELGISPQPEAVAKYKDAQNAFWKRNHAAAFGLVGMCMGLSWAITTANRHKLSTALSTGMIAAICGSIAGYLTGPFYARGVIESSTQSLTESLIFHAIGWTSIAVPIFASVAFLQESRTRALNCTIAGLLGGASMALIYILLASTICTSENVASLIPTSSTAKAIWITSGLMSIGLGGYLTIQPPRAMTSQA
jgi:hypothetical protein